MNDHANTVISPLPEIHQWERQEIESFVSRLEAGYERHLPGLRFGCKEQILEEVAEAVRLTAEVMILDSLDNDEPLIEWPRVA